MKIKGLPDFLKSIESDDEDEINPHLFDFPVNPSDLTDEEIKEQLLIWKQTIRDLPKEKVVNYLYSIENTEIGVWGKELEDEKYKEYKDNIEGLTVKEVRNNLKEAEEELEAYRSFIDDLKALIESRIPSKNEYDEELKPFAGKHYTVNSIIDLTGLPIQDAINSDPYLIGEESTLDDEIKMLGASATPLKDFNPEMPTYSLTFENIFPKDEVTEDVAKIKFKILDGSECFISEDALASIDPSLRVWWSKWNLQSDYSSYSIVAKTTDIVRGNDDLFSDLSKHINVVYDAQAPGSLSVYNYTEKEIINSLFDINTGGFGNITEAGLLVEKAKEVLANEPNKYRKLNNVIKEVYEYDVDAERAIVENPEYMQYILALSASMSNSEKIKHIILPNEDDAIFPGDFRDTPNGKLISSHVSSANMSSTSEIHDENEMRKEFFRFFGTNQLTLGELNSIANGQYYGAEFDFEKYSECLVTPIYFSNKYVALFVDADKEFTKYGFYITAIPEEKDLWNLFVPTAGNPIDELLEDIVEYTDTKYFDKNKDYKMDLLANVLGQADLHIYKSHENTRLGQIGEPIFVMHRAMTEGQTIDLGYLIFNYSDEAKKFKLDNGIDTDCKIIPLSAKSEEVLPPDVQDIIKTYLNLTGHLSDIKFIMEAETKYLLGSICVDIDIGKLLTRSKEEDE